MAVEVAATAAAAVEEEEAGPAAAEVAAAEGINAFIPEKKQKVNK
jgi:hypothetical protein